MRPFVLSFLVGMLTIPVLAFFYLHFGHLPVAVADQAFPMEKLIVKVPLRARVEKEMPSGAPISAGDANLIAGAQIYREQCAFCHGLYSQRADIGAHMYPHAPQLWIRHGGGVVGVSDDPPGETYWKVVNGIRLTGMPAFNKSLNDTQMWQVSLLLKNADKPIPDAAMKLVSQPLDFVPHAAIPAISPRSH